MSDVFDRLEKGPQDTTTHKYDDWNQMVGDAPADRSASTPTTTYAPTDTMSETRQDPRDMAGSLINRFLNNKALMAGTALAGAAYLARKSRQRKQQQQG